VRYIHLPSSELIPVSSMLNLFSPISSLFQVDIFEDGASLHSPS